MLRQKFGGILRLSWLVVAVLAWSSPHVNASRWVVSGPTDFWVSYEVPTVFVAETVNVEGGWSDPMLWLYDEAGTLVAANDDYYGLQSHIEIEVPAGSYRLRAGVCCGDPDAWRGGWQYEVVTDAVAVVPSTPVETTVWLPPSTQESVVPSSVVESSTTVAEPETTVTAAPTTVPEIPNSSTSTVVETTVEVATSEVVLVPTTEAPAPVEVAPPVAPSSTSTPTVPTGTIAVTTTSSVVESTSTTAIPETTVLPSTTGVVPVSSSGVGLVDRKPAAKVDASPPVGSDEYVPEGSTITVAQRRVVVAATAVMFILPAPTAIGQRGSDRRRK